MFHPSFAAEKNKKNTTVKSNFYLVFPCHSRSAESVAPSLCRCLRPKLLEPFRGRYTPKSKKENPLNKANGISTCFCHLVDQAVAFRQSSTRPLKYKPSYFSDGGTMKMYEHVLTSLVHTCTSSITAVRTSSSNPTARAFWASWIHWISDRLKIRIATPIRIPQPTCQMLFWIHSSQPNFVLRLHTSNCAWWSSNRSMWIITQAWLRSLWLSCMAAAPLYFSFANGSPAKAHSAFSSSHFGAWGICVRNWKSHLDTTNLTNPAMLQEFYAQQGTVLGLQQLCLLPSWKQRIWKPSLFDSFLAPQH